MVGSSFVFYNLYTKPTNLKPFSFLFVAWVVYLGPFWIISGKFNIWNAVQIFGGLIFDD